MCSEWQSSRTLLALPQPPVTWWDSSKCGIGNSVFMLGYLSTSNPLRPLKLYWMEKSRANTDFQSNFWALSTAETRVTTLQVETLQAATFSCNIALVSKAMSKLAFVFFELTAPFEYDVLIHLLSLLTLICSHILHTYICLCVWCVFSLWPSVYESLSPAEKEVDVSLITFICLFFPFLYSLDVFIHQDTLDEWK